MDQQLSAEDEALARHHQEVAERAEKRAANLNGGLDINDYGNGGIKGNGNIKKATFLTKQQREEQALERLQSKRTEQDSASRSAEDAHNRFDGRSINPSLFC